jgi:small subunit ribosomal protein S13
MKYKKQNNLLKKRVFLNLFGIGLKSKQLCFNQIGLNNRINILNINDKKINQINKQLNLKVKGKKLIFIINKHIAFYKSLHNYRGIRHKQLKPVRGQRTKTNAKTRRKKNSISIKTSSK